MGEKRHLPERLPLKLGVLVDVMPLFLMKRLVVR